MFAAYGRNWMGDMGEAKRRGDYAERKAEAIDAGREKVKKLSKKEFEKIRLDILRELVRKNSYEVIG